MWGPKGAQSLRVQVAMVSCLSGEPMLFSELPQQCCTSPHRVFSCQLTLVLSLESDLQSLSLSTQPPLTTAGCKETVSRLESIGWQWSFHFTFWAPVAEFPSEVPKLLQSTPERGFPSVKKLFLLHGSLPEAQVPALKSFVSLFSYIFCPTSFRGDWLVFLAVWILLPAFRRCSVRTVSHVDDLWGGGWFPPLTPLPSWKSSSSSYFWKFDDDVLLCYFVFILLRVCKVSWGSIFMPFLKFENFCYYFLK